MSTVINALLNQARQYVQNNDGRAEKAFSMVLENDTFNVEARTFLARVAMQAGQPLKALEHLQVASRVNPNNAALWRSLGLAHAALNQWSQAQEALEQSQHDLNEAQSVANVGSYSLNVETFEAQWSDETYKIFNRIMALVPQKKNDC